MTPLIKIFQSKIDKIYLTLIVVIRKNYLKRKIVKFRQISSKITTSWKWNLTAFDNPIFIIMKSN